jgi:hypothetical protein
MDERIKKKIATVTLLNLKVELLLEASVIQKELITTYYTISQTQLINDILQKSKVTNI